MILAGSGGHARVVLDVATAAGMAVTGWCGPPHDGAPTDLPRLGGDDLLRDPARWNGATGALLGVGENRVRARIAGMATEGGLELPPCIHPWAWLSPRASIAPGVAVMAGVVVNTDATIGQGAILNTGCSVDHDCTVGAFAHIAPGVRLAGSITVGEGAFIGVGTSVIPGVSIGAWSVVGAGAAVIDDVPAGAVWAGVPAREITRC